MDKVSDAGTPGVISTPGLVTQPHAAKSYLDPRYWLMTRRLGRT